MSAVLAPQTLPVHVDPESLARFVDGRDASAEAVHHLRHCELCRARASDARLLRALIAGSRQSSAAAIPLDASTLAGYLDQALAPDQMAAVDRRLLRDNAALLELIELRLALNAALRADAPDAQLVARTAATFSSGQSPQSQRIASLGTLIVDRQAEVPVFRFHAATPENIAGLTGKPAHPAVNDSGSYPAPAARRELALHAGRHTVRVRMAAGGRIEMFVFDEQHFRPANGVQVTCEPDDAAPAMRSTNRSGFVAFDLPPGHARLRIDAGDRWLLELR